MTMVYRIVVVIEDVQLQETEKVVGETPHYGPVALQAWRCQAAALSPIDVK